MATLSPWIHLFEAILPGFFFPGYGLSGVPLYLIDEPARYLKDAIFEEKLGVSAKFSDVIAVLGEKNRGFAAGGRVLEPRARRTGACWAGRLKQKAGLGASGRGARFPSGHAAAQHLGPSELCFGTHRLSELSFQHRCLSRRDRRIIL